VTTAPCSARWTASGTLVLLITAFASSVRLQTPSWPTGQGAHTGTGAVSGQVIDGSTGRGIGNVIITIGIQTGRASASGSNQATDALGRFVFASLPAGSFVLAAVKPGYIDGGLGSREGLTSPTVSAPIVLAEGQWVHDVDLVMWRWSSISGTVVDELGEPMVGIPVRALEQLFVAGESQLAAGPIATTDDRGVYRISKLRAGTYFVTVPSVHGAVPAATGPRPAPTSTTSAGDASLDVGAYRLAIGDYPTPPPRSADQSQSYPVTFFTAATSAANATSIELAAGENHVGADIGLRPVQAVRVSGQVVGPTDATRGLVLRLLPDGSGDLGVGSEQATTVVEPDGGFTFLDVPLGGYEILARRLVAEFVDGAPVALGLPAMRGWVGAGSSGVRLSSAPDGALLAIRRSDQPNDYEGRLRVQVGSVDVKGITVRVYPTRTLSGRIVYDGQAPTVGALSPTLFGDPATGRASLSVLPPRASVRSPDDLFAIPGLSDGEYFVRLEGGTKWTIESITGGGNDYTDRPVDMTSGDITGLVVTLTDKITQLTGTVRDDHHQPVGQGTVVVFPSDERLWRRFGFEPPRIKTASFFGAGEYRVSGLPKGEYFVVALDVSRRGAWQNPEFFQAAVPSAVRVSLDWAASRTVDLTLSQPRVK
jgi:hypothetical protein